MQLLGLMGWSAGHLAPQSCVIRFSWPSVLFIPLFLPLLVTHHRLPSWHSFQGPSFPALRFATHLLSERTGMLGLQQHVKVDCRGFHW